MTDADRRGHRADGRDRPRVPARAGPARPRARDGAAAVRSRRRSGWRTPSTARATCSTATRSTRSPRRPTCSSTSRSSSSAAATETREVNLTGSRNVFAAARAREAARLHVVGRRLRLPRRQPAAADRGRPAARQRGASTTRRRRPSSSRRWRRRSRERRGGVRAAAVHRRRAGRAGAPAPAPAEPAPGADRSRCCPTRASRSSSSTTTTSRRRSSPRRSGQGPPGAYNLAGEGTITLGDLARALGWLSVPVPRAAGPTSPSLSAKLPLVPTIAEWLVAGRVPVVMDTTRARTRPGLEAALQHARDAGRASRGVARRARRGCARR